MYTYPDNWLKKTALPHLALLLLLTMIAYSNIWNAGFMSWDDLEYVQQIPALNTGIGWEQLKDWFTSYYIGNYQPLPAFTYAIDHLLGHGTPLAYHLDSLLWHLAAIVAVYLLANKLQSNPWVSFFVALLFAIHPVQTESVSWIAARNKSMNAFFYFCAMITYVQYVGNNHLKPLIITTLLGVLAYLCKATAVALPIALFAIDIWLKRPLNNKRVWLEKIPLVVCAIPIAWATLDAQAQVKFLESHTQGISLNSFVYAGYAFVQYIANLLFPFRLSVLYPYPRTIETIHIVFALAAAALLVGTVLAYRKKWYILAGGLVFFTANMLPVLQFVQFGEVLMADRYLYIACIGIWLPLVYYLFVWAKEKQLIAIVTLSMVSTMLLSATSSRNKIWLNELNFWNSVIDRFPESAVAQYSVGGLYMRSGNLPEAAAHLDIAVALEPGNAKAWYNKGLLHLRQNKPMEALEALDKSIAINGYYKAYLSRAMLHQQGGQPETALEDALKVLEKQPNNTKAHYIAADSYEKLGQPTTAIAEYTAAIRGEEREPLYYIRRGLVLAKTNDNKAALADLEKAVELAPASGEAYYYRGIMKYRNQQDPCSDLRAALQNGYAPAKEAMEKTCK